MCRENDFTFPQNELTYMASGLAQLSELDNSVTSEPNRGSSSATPNLCGGAAS